MIYLSGHVHDIILSRPRPDLGVMLQPAMGNRPNLAALPWAADNGCFSQGDRFDAGDWLEWLAGLRRHRASCLFAVAPDVLCDASATWERSKAYLPTIRQLGFPAALVGQNGFDADQVDWDSVDVLFLGGDDAWKLGEMGGYAAARAAKLRGKKVHMGRVNSLRRLRAARTALIDSADGTFVRFGPDRRLPEVYDWLEAVNGQLGLEGSA